MYIYQEILDEKRRYSVSLRDCSSLNLKISVIGLGELNNLFSQFFPEHPVSLKKHYIFKNCREVCAKPS